MNVKNINNFLNNNEIYSSNSNISNNTPKLIEPGVKYFFKNVLKSCNEFKYQNYSLYYNISLLLLFIFILGITLYTRYKGNKTKAEIYNESIKNKQYIMSKLVYFNKQNIDNQQRIRNNMITNLPDYNNHPEASLLHQKIYF